MKKALMIITILSLIAAACAPSAQPAAPAPAKPAAPAAPAAAPAPAKPAEPKVVAEKPRRGGTWSVTGEIFSDPPSLDMARRGGATTLFVYSVASCKLVSWNESPGRPPGSLEQVLPDLAERWESLEGGLKWVFQLRKGVMLPNGREVTAADVVRSWERDAWGEGGALKRNARSAHTLVDAKKNIWKPNIEAPDKYTVVIKLNQPDADFLSQMGGHWWAIFFEDFMEKSADGWGEVKNWNQVRGCGPYYPVEYVPASHMIFERNPNYMFPDLAYVDKVNHRFLFEPNVIAAAFRAGQLDALSPMQNIPTSIALELDKDPTLSVKWIPAAWEWNWTLDLREGSPWRDVRVRRALALAVDAEGIIKNLFSGRGTNYVVIQPLVQRGILLPKDMGEDGKYYTGYNPEEAKRLLREAGYTKGFTFELIHSNSAGHVVAHPIWEVIFSYLEALDMGVKGKLKIVDYGALGAHPTPLGGARAGGIARPDLESFVHSSIHPDYVTMRVEGGKQIYPFKELLERDPEFVRAVQLMDEQKRTFDEQQRIKLVHELQRLYARNVWKYFPPVPSSPVITNKRVRDYEPAGGWNGGTWKYVWLAK